MKKRIFAVVLLILILICVPMEILAAEETAPEDQNNAKPTVFETVIDKISGPLFTLVIGGVILGVFKGGVKIFQAGINYKASLVTKREQREFEQEIRKDLRAYKAELQKAVLDACMRVIQQETKEFDSIKETAENMKILKATISNDINQLGDFKEDISAIGNQVNVLKERVGSLEQRDTGEGRRHA